MENTIQIQKAIAKAVALHNGQYRKGSKALPYIVHPLDVALIVQNYIDYEPAVIAALLHDTIEDCGYAKEDIAKDYGPEVAELVSLLTMDKTLPAPRRRKENIERLKESKMAMFIKICDCLSNMKSLISGLKSEGPSFWNSFHSARQDILRYYRDMLTQALPILLPRLIVTYTETLKDLEFADTAPKALLVV